MQQFLRNVFMPCVGIFLLTFALTAKANTQGPSITTDKTGYVPGAAVSITGSGFEPSEMVTLQVLPADVTGDDDTNPAYQQWTVQADNSGNVSATWTAPSDEDTSGATFQLTAYAQLSGVQTEWTFAVKTRNATVTSDQPDYLPRSTATFTGNGFAPFENVVLKVKNLFRPCNTVSADSSYLPWTIQADAAGSFVTTWTVCDCNGDSLRLKATGQTSGSIAYTYFTDASITPATGGSAISAGNVTTGTYTALTGPVLSESSSGNIGTGTIVLNAPTGFNFDVGGTPPTVLITRTGFFGGANSRNINGVASGTSVAITSRTTTAITFTVTSASNNLVTCSLTWQNIRVIPVNGTPLASGNITKTGTSVISSGVNATSNFGTLTEVGGALETLTISNIPSPQTAGTPFSVTITGKDHFNNNANGTLTMSTDAGTISPATVPMTNGTTGSVSFTVTQAGSFKTITATNGSVSEPSNDFTVNPRQSVASDNFRTKTSGDWNNTGTWESQPLTPVGSNWFDATLTPTSAAGTVAILSGHSVAVTEDVAIDQTTVNSGGEITVSDGARLDVRAGTGTDLNIASGGDVVVDGFLRSENNAAITSNASSLIIEASGTYEHNSTSSAGTIPTATWNSGSTCALIGYTTNVTAPVGLNQAFSNFTINMPAYVGGTVLLFFPGGLPLTGLTTINGDFNIINTGTGTAGFALIPPSVTVGGNFIQSGGVTGAYNFQGGTGIMNLKGDYTMTGGSMTNTGGTLAINFAGTTKQTYTKTGGTFSGNVNFAINSGAIVDFGTSVIDGSTGTFNLNSGGTIITANNAGLTSTGATGTIQSTGTRTYNSGANYEFQGSNTGTFNSSTNPQVNNLTINNSAGVTLGKSFTVNGTLDFKDGIVTPGAFDLIISATGNITNFSSLKYINGKLQRVYAATGVKTFPIGKGGNYRPVDFNYTTLAGTKTVGIEQFEGAYPTTVPPNVSVAHFEQRYWKITQSATGSSYTVSLNGNGVSLTGTPVIIRREGTGAANANPASFSAPNYTNSTAFSTTNATNDVALGETGIPLTITGVIANNKPYDGNLMATLNTASAALSGVVSGDVVTLNSGSATGTFSDKNVGTGKTVTTSNFVLSGANAGAYSLTQPTTTADIIAIAASVTPASNSKEYGSTDPVLTGSTSGFLEDDNVLASYSREAGETVNGSPYTISATLSPDEVLSNYDITYNTANFNITPKAASVTANNKTKTYGDDNPALDATVTGTVNGDVLDYTLATTASKFSGAGSYPITVTLGTNPNYTVTSDDATLTIDPKAAHVAAIDKSKTYGDDNPVLDATVTGTVNGDVLDYTLATTASKFSGAGSYPITVTLGTNPNYTVTSDDATLTIDPKAAHVAAIDKSKTYGDDNPALDATVTGTVNNDVLDYTLATTASKFSGAGSYPITVTLGTNPNYTVTSDDATLTIDPKAAHVAAIDKSKTYGDDNPALDATVTGTVNDDVLDYTLATTASKFSGAGSYPITVTLGTNPNYTVTSGDATLTINPKAASVIPIAAGKHCGDADPMLTGILTGFLASDNVTAIYTRIPGETVAGSPYTISATLSSTGVLSNYTITYNTALFTITDIAAPVISALPGPSIINCPATPSFAAATATDCSPYTLTYNDVTTSGSCAGNYTVTRTWTATDESNNVSTASQTIKVQDITAPTFTRPADKTIYTDASCNYNASLSVTGDVTNESDYCSSGLNATYTDVVTNGSCQGSKVITRTWHLVDNCGNAAADQVQTITVTDNTAPVITTCAPSVTVAPNFSGCTSKLLDYRNAVTATDNCSIVTLTQSPAMGTALPLGANIVTITATDACGNSTNCKFTVTVTKTLDVTVGNTNPQLYYGYALDQSTVIKGSPTGGVAPYKVVITMDRILGCNAVNSTGDEIWTATGGNTTGNICPTAGTVASIPVSTITNVAAGGSYSVTATLMKDAVFTVTVTDANGCSVSKITTVNAEDVRCFAGNSGNAKVQLCHKTGSDKNPCVTICVDASAVEEHLAHGDTYGACPKVGPCPQPSGITSSGSSTSASATVLNDKLQVKVMPNPSVRGIPFTLTAKGNNKEELEIRVLNVLGQEVYKTKGSINETYKFGSQFMSGIYLVQVIQGQKVQIFKIIKQ